MAYCEFSDVAITGVAVAVPKTVSVNKNSAILPEKQISRFIKNVGVEQKRISIKEQTSSDLGYEAAKALLEYKAISPESVDALIFLTQNADYFTPSTAYVIACRLELSKNCMPFDVNLGCSAFVYGVHMASSFIQGGGMKKALVVIADVPKKGFANENDTLLFGDCGSAVLVEKKEGASIKSLLKSDGNRYTALVTRGGLSRHPVDVSKNYYEQVGAGMNGEDVMSFSITDVPETINDFLTKTEQNIRSFDAVLLHQANMMMDKTIIKKINAEPEKVPFSMDRFGNVNGSSIPLTLVDFIERTKVLGKLSLLSSGFGVGLSWGVNSFEIDTADVLPLIETDNYFKEAY